MSDDDTRDIEYEGPGLRALILPVPAEDAWGPEVDGDGEVRDAWVGDSASGRDDSIEASDDDSDDSVARDDSWSDDADDDSLVDVVYDILP